MGTVTKTLENCSNILGTDTAENAHCKQTDEGAGVLGSIILQDPENACEGDTATCEGDNSSSNMICNNKTFNQNQTKFLFDTSLWPAKPLSCNSQKRQEKDLSSKMPTAITPLLIPLRKTPKSPDLYNSSLDINGNIEYKQTGDVKDIGHIDLRKTPKSPDLYNSSIDIKGHIEYRQTGDAKDIGHIDLFNICPSNKCTDNDLDLECISLRKTDKSTDLENSKLVQDIQLSSNIDVESQSVDTNPLSCIDSGLDILDSSCAEASDSNSTLSSHVLLSGPAGWNCLENSQYHSGDSNKTHGPEKHPDMVQPHDSSRSISIDRIEKSKIVVSKDGSEKIFVPSSIQDTMQKNISTEGTDVSSVVGENEMMAIGEVASHDVLSGWNHRELPRYVEEQCDGYHEFTEENSTDSEDNVIVTINPSASRPSAYINLYANGQSSDVPKEVLIQSPFINHEQNTEKYLDIPEESWIRNINTPHEKLTTTESSSDTDSIDLRSNSLDALRKMQVSPSLDNLVPMKSADSLITSDAYGSSDNKFKYDTDAGYETNSPRWNKSLDSKFNRWKNKSSTRSMDAENIVQPPEICIKSALKQSGSHTDITKHVHFDNELTGKESASACSISSVSSENCPKENKSDSSPESNKNSSDNSDPGVNTMSDDKRSMSSSSSDEDKRAQFQLPSSWYSNLPQHAGTKLSDTTDTGPDTPGTPSYKDFFKSESCPDRFKSENDGCEISIEDEVFDSELKPQHATSNESENEYFDNSPRIIELNPLNKYLNEPSIQKILKEGSFNSKQTLSLFNAIIDAQASEKEERKSEGNNKKTELEHLHNDLNDTKLELRSLNKQLRLTHSELRQVSNERDRFKNTIKRLEKQVQAALECRAMAQGRPLQGAHSGRLYNQPAHNVNTPAIMPSPAAHCIPPVVPPLAPLVHRAPAPTTLAAPFVRPAVPNAPPGMQFMPAVNGGFVTLPPYYNLPPPPGPPPTIQLIEQSLINKQSTGRISHMDQQSNTLPNTMAQNFTTVSITKPMTTNMPPPMSPTIPQSVSKRVDPIVPLGPSASHGSLPRSSWPTPAEASSMKTLDNMNWGNWHAKGYQNNRHPSQTNSRQQFQYAPLESTSEESLWDEEDEDVLEKETLIHRRRGVEIDPVKLPVTVNHTNSFQENRVIPRKAIAHASSYPDISQDQGSHSNWSKSEISHYKGSYSKSTRHDSNVHESVSNEDFISGGSMSEDESGKSYNRRSGRRRREGVRDAAPGQGYDRCWRSRTQYRVEPNS